LLAEFIQSPNILGWRQEAGRDLPNLHPRPFLEQEHRTIYPPGGGGGFVRWFVCFVRWFMYLSVGVWIFAVDLYYGISIDERHLP
jgi:hypothetical protein